MNIDLNRLEFWAKTDKEGNPGISVLEHMRHVGHVAYHIAEQNKEQLKRFNISIEEVASLAALHDIGKISQGFQRKCAAWLQLNNLLDEDIANAWYVCEQDHSKSSQYTLQQMIKKNGRKTGSSALWALIVGIHHSRIYWTERGLISETGMNQDDWENIREEQAKIIFSEFGPLPQKNINRANPLVWWLAGLISIADWIGSDERFFNPLVLTKDIKKVAKDALNSLCFVPPKVKSQLSFNDLFNFDSSNDLQEKVFSTIKEPGIYCIEAPMGMGKTEAAFWCSYNLMDRGLANGIYFALPTQATSNRIHYRMDDFINKITEEKQVTRLVHGNSWLMEDIGFPKISSIEGEKDDVTVIKDWFASKKRVLLSPFGVGTVDQALLAVIAVKHFFVRRFALAGKVVILDEVHSYDIYTGTLIEKLCNELVKLGCTVLLLSATLTAERRNKLLNIDVEDNLLNSYPLITGKTEKGKVILPVEVEPPKPSEYQIVFSGIQDCYASAIDVAQRGGCVLWICNTISNAQNVYSTLFDRKDSEPFEIGLLHSRFPFCQREELENHWMEILGRGNENRKPCILISTQIVEQSVDLDADMLITELAPTDMLLQRMGRLWRHRRENRPVENAVAAIISEEKSLQQLRDATSKELKEILGAKAWVYSPYILLKSLEVWSDAVPLMTLPADIPDLLKNTYTESENEPESWVELSNEWFGNDYAKRQIAERETNEFQKFIDDVEGMNTRLNERPTVEMILLKSRTDKEWEFIDGTCINVSAKSFNIAVARVVNKNIVKIPRHILLDENNSLPENRFMGDYIRGEYVCGLVEGNEIIVQGLNSKEILKYSVEKGVEIVKRNRE